MVVSVEVCYLSWILYAGESTVEVCHLSWIPYAGE